MVAWQVAKYAGMERVVADLCSKTDAAYTVVRAGTLKGGASGSSLNEEDGGGEASFLNPAFYKLGMQDVTAAAHPSHPSRQLLTDCC